MNPGNIAFNIVEEACSRGLINKEKLRKAIERELQTAYEYGREVGEEDCMNEKEQ